MQLVIPMSGQGSRFRARGFQDPKPLIKINGTSIIERLLNCFPKEWECFFVLSEAHKETQLEVTLKDLRPLSKVVYIAPHSEGPGKALYALKDCLKPEQPTLVSYCDYGMKWDAQDFSDYVQRTQSDCCLVSYSGYHAHYVTETPYAYSWAESNSVKNIKEKGWFKNREIEFASNGLYYFKTAHLLFEGLDLQYSQKNFVNGESYTSLTVASLMDHRPELFVTVYEIPCFYQWGTPDDLLDYEYWERSFGHYFQKNNPINFEQILVPMVGFGGRFKKDFTVPKPFLKIQGKALYQRSVQGFLGEKYYIAHSGYEKFMNVENVTYLPEVIKGQALATFEGVKKLNHEQEVFVTNCDHEVVIDHAEFLKVKQEADAIIFTIKGFPGCRRSANSYAYVKTNMLNDVDFVSNKQPLSETPDKDDLLVGSFWFRSAKILNTFLEKQISANQSENGELYLDAIFNLMLAEGKKVKFCRLKSYVNWGDPDLMAEGLYWYEVFGGHQLQKRKKFHGVDGA